MDSKSLSIFFPCYNDAKTIGPLVAQADRVARELTDDFEILVVDDGSSEASRDLLKELKTKYPTLGLIFHDKNQGYGAALCSGFRHATKDWVFYTDGDGQFDVGELRNLWREVMKGVLWVNGYKISRRDPAHRIVIGNVYQWLTRRLFKFQVRDVTCDFRLIRRLALDAIQLRHTSGAVCIELVKKLETAGFRSVDHPVHHYPRPYGRSQFFNWRNLWKTGIDLVRLWWEFRINGTL